MSLFSRRHWKRLPDVFMHAALLRGINVGGKNPVPMKELAGLFAKAGCRKVQTYIQSGNVIFEASPAVLDGLAEQLSEAITKQFGLRVPVILRSAEQVRGVLTSNPFLQEGSDTETPEDMLHVYFLAQQPTAEQVALLDGSRGLPDTFAVHGREVYLRMPNGMGRTKLTNAYFDSRLSTTSTARNWRTVKKISELMSL